MERSGHKPDTVREELLRILASPGFVNAPRLSEFLRFVVDQTVDGHGGSLKEYVVGTRVYHKTVSFDPRVDATVRVEAHKLRSRLHEYYSGAGRDDRVVISIPKGSYAACFENRRGSLRVFPLWAWTYGVAIAITTIGICVAGMQHIRRDPAPVTRPLTTYPGGQYEPALSPDGGRLAFVWNANGVRSDIYIQPVGGQGLLRLTGGPGASGSPAWSPDGNRIAFVREGDAIETSAVMITEVRGGGEYRLTAAWPMSAIHERRLDWSRTGDLLVLVDRTAQDQPFSIHTISVRDGRRRRVTAPSEGSEDWGPVFSPDGKFIAFRRIQRAGASDIYVVAAAGGEARRITFDDRLITSQAWTADGSELIFASDRSGAPGLWRVSARGGNAVKIPYLGEGASTLTVARAGSRLAYSQPFADLNIWRYPLRGPGQPVPLIASTRSDVNPQYSPDGRKIAFRSARSGVDEIWVSDSDGTNPRALTQTFGVLGGRPRWSPDGHWIAFDSRPQKRSQIMVVDASGGTPVRVTSEEHDARAPSWSSDGRWIYFASDAGGEYQVWKTAWDPQGGKEHPIQVTKRGGFVGFESYDGRYLYYSKGSNQPGLYRIATGSGTEQLVVSSFAPGMQGNWATTHDALYWVEMLADRHAYLFTQNLNSPRTRRIRMLEGSPYAEGSGLSVSPGSESFLYVQADHSGSEIMLVEHFR